MITSYIFTLIFFRQFILPGPVETPPPRQEQPQQVELLQPGEHLGIGILRPKSTEFLNNTDWITNPKRNLGWLMRVHLPVFDKPGGQPWGWLYNGWLVPEIGSKKPLDQSALPPLNPLPVLITTNDGRSSVSAPSPYVTHDPKDGRPG